MRTTLLLTLLMSSGCVLKGKHNDIVDDFHSRIAGLQGEIEARDAQLAEQGASYEDSQQMLASLQQSATDTEAEMQAEIDALTVELESTRDSLTRALSGRRAREAELAQMREAVAELERRKARAEASLTEYRDLVGRFQSLIDAGTLRVTVIDGRMVVELATDILFAAGRATVSDEGQAAVVEVAGVLASIPNRQFQIAGHTDNRPIATAQFPSNWELGAARALAVTKLMVDNGLVKERVSGASYADTKPAATNDTDEGRALNRRIEIVVVPDLSELPGYDELEALAQDGE